MNAKKLVGILLEDGEPAQRPIPYEKAHGHVFELTNPNGQAVDAKVVGYGSMGVEYLLDPASDWQLNHDRQSDQQLRKAGWTLPYIVATDVRHSELSRLASKVRPTSESLARRVIGEAYGDATAGASGVSVWVLVRLRQLGLSSREILEQYPGMTAVDLQAADAYAAAHPDEIEAEIRANEADLGESAARNVSTLLEAGDFDERDPHELTSFKERDPAGFNLTPEQQAVFDKWFGELKSAVRAAYEDSSVYMFFVYQAMSGILKDLGWPNEKAHLVRDYLIQRLDDDKVHPYEGGAHKRFLSPKDRPSKAKTRPKGWMVGDPSGTSASSM